MAAWQLVTPLVRFRTQLNALAPNRDKASDGSIGDFAHSQGRSDHNPDDTPGSNPGWNGDGDSTPDVRAIDVDRDLRTPGVAMEDVLAHLLKYCRNGTFWWVRYIIFDGYIYEKSNGYAKRSYSGKNPHDHHMHISSDYSEAADDAQANWRLEEVFEMAIDADDINKIAIKVANVLGLVVENGIAQVKAGGKDYGSYNGLLGTIGLRTDYMNNTWMDAVSARLTAQDQALSATKSEVASLNAKVQSLQSAVSVQNALLSQIAQALGISGGPTTSAAKKQ